jgi:chromosome segregation ATPase
MVAKRSSQAVTKSDFNGLENKFSGLSSDVSELKAGLFGLRSDFAKLMEKLDQKFDAIDQKFEANDRKFESIDKRFDAMDRAFGQLREDVDSKLAATARNTMAVLRATDERIGAVDRKLDETRAVMTTRFDRILDELGDLKRAHIIYPALFDEQGATLRTHEQRISALEARKAP